MNVIEISKYAPALVRTCRYLTDDWTSVSQLGEPWHGAPLTAAAYLDVEDRYVRAAARFVAAAGVGELRIHGLEHWDELGAQPPGLELPPRPPPREGELVTAADLDGLLRRFLREQAWAELVVAPVFLIHPGHDLRLVIATVAPTDALEAATRRDGLFTHRREPGASSPLATLEEWTAASAPP